MNLLGLFCLLIAISSGVSAATTSSSSLSSSSSSSSSSTSEAPTLVWITLKSNGVPYTTEQVAYSQSFYQLYSAIASPSSGSVGLGSDGGSVGGIRTYSVFTVSSGTSHKISTHMSTGVSFTVKLILTWSILAIAYIIAL